MAKSIGYYNSKQCKIAAFLTLLVFLFTSLGVAEQAPSGVTAHGFGQNAPRQKRSSLKIPPDIGILHEVFQSGQGPLIVLIQDAHSIPEAQEHIQKLILYFQSRQGVNLITLEGASGRLDPQIFRSFPDKKRLHQVFDEYAAKGELTGVNAAAIFSKAPGIYHGVEDWKLYEEGRLLYLGAMNQKAGLLEKLREANQKLAALKNKFYSRKLFKADQTLERFYDNPHNFARILLTLAAIKKPAHGTALWRWLKAIRTKKDSAGKIKRVADRVKLLLRSSGEERQKKPDFGKNIQLEFSQKYQEFETSQIPPEVFAFWIKETLDSIAAHLESADGETQPGLRAQINSIRQGLSSDKQLRHIVREQKWLRDRQGADLFAEFETYAREVKAGLISSAREKDLERRSRLMRFMVKMAKLELTRQEWREWAEIQPMKRRSFPGIDFTNHMRFYQNAEEREKAFVRHLMKRVKKYRAPSAMLVTGGFHTEGLAERLKAMKISYVLASPRIRSIPETNSYEGQMKGAVSWKDYERPKHGKIRLYHAFVRAARDRLLGLDIQKYGVGAERYKGMCTGGDISPHAPEFSPHPSLLKSWRDQLLLDLAGQNRLAESRDYTKFLDEISQSAHTDSTRLLQSKWRENVERLIARLRNLEAKNRLNEWTVLKVLKSASIVPARTSAALSVYDELSVADETFFPKFAAAPEAVFVDTKGWNQSIRAESRHPSWRETILKGAQEIGNKGLLSFPVLAYLGLLHWAGSSFWAGFTGLAAMGSLFALMRWSGHPGGRMRAGLNSRNLKWGLVIGASVLFFDLYGVILQQLFPGLGDLHTMLINTTGFLIWSVLSFIHLARYTREDPIEGIQLNPLRAQWVLGLLPLAAMTVNLFLFHYFPAWSHRSFHESVVPEPLTLGLMMLFQAFWTGLWAAASIGHKLPAGTVLYAAGGITNVFENYLFGGAHNTLPMFLGTGNPADFLMAAGVGLLVADFVGAEREPLYKMLGVVRSYFNTKITAPNLSIKQFFSLGLVGLVLSLPHLARYWLGNRFQPAAVQVPESGIVFTPHGEPEEDIDHEEKLVQRLRFVISHWERDLKLPRDPIVRKNYDFFEQRPGLAIQLLEKHILPDLLISTGTLNSSDAARFFEDAEFKQAIVEKWARPEPKDAWPYNVWIFYHRMTFESDWQKRHPEGVGNGKPRGRSEQRVESPDWFDLRYEANFQFDKSIEIKRQRWVVHELEYQPERSYVVSRNLTLRVRPILPRLWRWLGLLWSWSSGLRNRFGSSRPQAHFKDETLTVFLNLDSPLSVNESLYSLKDVIYKILDSAGYALSTLEYHDYEESVWQTIDEFESGEDSAFFQTLEEKTNEWQALYETIQYVQMPNGNQWKGRHPRLGSHLRRRLEFAPISPLSFQSEGLSLTVRLDRRKSIGETSGDLYRIVISATDARSEKRAQEILGDAKWFLKKHLVDEPEAEIYLPSSEIALVMKDLAFFVDQKRNETLPAVQKNSQMQFVKNYDTTFLRELSRRLNAISKNNGGFDKSNRAHLELLNQADELIRRFERLLPKERSELRTAKEWSLEAYRDFIASFGDAGYQNLSWGYIELYGNAGLHANAKKEGWNFQIYRQSENNNPIDVYDRRYPRGGDYFSPHRWTHLAFYSDRIEAEAVIDPQPAEKIKFSVPHENALKGTGFDEKAKKLIIFMERDARTQLKRELDSRRIKLSHVKLSVTSSRRSELRNFPPMPESGDRADGELQKIMNTLKGSLYYPAWGGDEYVFDAMSRLPAMESIILLDTDQPVDSIAQVLGRRRRVKKLSGKTLLIKEANRDYKAYLVTGDAIDFEIPGDLSASEQKINYALIKNPGAAAYLSDVPEFYLNILRNLSPGGLVEVLDASLPLVFLTDEISLLGLRPLIGKGESRYFQKVETVDEGVLHRIIEMDRLLASFHSLFITKKTGDWTAQHQHKWLKLIRWLEDQDNLLPWDTTKRLKDKIKMLVRTALARGAVPTLLKDWLEGRTPRIPAPDPQEIYDMFLKALWSGSAKHASLIYELPPIVEQLDEEDFEKIWSVIDSENLWRDRFAESDEDWGMEHTDLSDAMKVNVAMLAKTRGWIPLEAGKTNDKLQSEGKSAPDTAPDARAEKREEYGSSDRLERANIEQIVSALEALLKNWMQQVHPGQIPLEYRWSHPEEETEQAVFQLGGETLKKALMVSVTALPSAGQTFLRVWIDGRPLWRADHSRSGTQTAEDFTDDLIAFLETQRLRIFLELHTLKPPSKLPLSDVRLWVESSLSSGSRHRRFELRNFLRGHDFLENGTANQIGFLHQVPLFVSSEDYAVLLWLNLDTIDTARDLSNRRGVVYDVHVRRFEGMENLDELEARVHYKTFLRADFDKFGGLGRWEIAPLTVNRLRYYSWLERFLENELSRRKGSPFFRAMDSDWPVHLTTLAIDPLKGLIRRSEVRNKHFGSHEDSAGDQARITNEIRVIRDILNSYHKRRGLSEFLKSEILLTLVYGGTLQYDSFEGNGKKRAWEKIYVPDLQGLEKLQSYPLSTKQKKDIERLKEVAVERLQKLGIRPAFHRYLFDDPAFQNPFLLTFLGTSKELGGTIIAESRLERAIERADFSPKDRAYIERFNDVFQPQIRTGIVGTNRIVEPYSIRVKHNNDLGPFKGGIRFIFKWMLDDDKGFNLRFDQLIEKGANLDELRYFLRKWIKEETLPLAFGMTSKAVPPQLPYGGAKGAVLFADVERKEDGGFVIHDYDLSDRFRKSLIRSYVRRLFEGNRVGHHIDIPAPDMGSWAGDMNIMMDEFLKLFIEKMKDDKSFDKIPAFLKERIAEIDQAVAADPDKGIFETLYLKTVSEYLKSLREQSKSVPEPVKELARNLATFTSKTTDLGGSEFRGDSTGRGGIHVLKEILKKEGYGDSPLHQMTAKIMGFGGVGRPAVRALIEEGAMVTMISEGPGGIVFKEGGFTLKDVDVLERLLLEKRNFTLLNVPDSGYSIKGASFITEKEFLNRHTNVYALAAKENTVNQSNVGDLKTDIIVELANGAITNEAYDRLLQDNVIVVSDTLANAGGVTVSFYEWLQNLNNEKWPRDQVQDALFRQLSSAVERVDKIRREFEFPLDWRTAADILMIREVLAARDAKSKTKKRTKAVLPRPEIRPDARIDFSEGIPKDFEQKRSELRNDLRRGRIDRRMGVQVLKADRRDDLLLIPALLEKAIEVAINVINKTEDDFNEAAKILSDRNLKVKPFMKGWSLQEPAPFTYAPSWDAAQRPKFAYLVVLAIGALYRERQPFFGHPTDKGLWEMTRDLPRALASEISKMLAVSPGIYLPWRKLEIEGQLVTGKKAAREWRRTLRHERLHMVFEERLQRSTPQIQSEFEHRKAAFRFSLAEMKRHLQSDNTFRTLYGDVTGAYRNLRRRSDNFAEEFWIWLFYPGYAFLSETEDRRQQQSLKDLRDKLRTQWIAASPEVREAFEVFDELLPYVDRLAEEDLFDLVEQGLSRDLGFEADDIEASRENRSEVRSSDLAQDEPDFQAFKRDVLKIASQGKPLHLGHLSRIHRLDLRLPANDRRIMEFLTAIGYEAGPNAEIGGPVFLLRNGDGEFSNTRAFQKASVDMAVAELQSAVSVLTELPPGINRVNFSSAAEGSDGHLALHNRLIINLSNFAAIAKPKTDKPGLNILREELKEWYGSEFKLLGKAELGIFGPESEMILSRADQHVRSAVDYLLLAAVGRTFQHSVEKIAYELVHPPANHTPIQASSQLQDFYTGGIDARLRARIFDLLAWYGLDSQAVNQLPPFIDRFLKLRSELRKSAARAILYAAAPEGIRKQMDLEPFDWHSASQEVTGTFAHQQWQRLRRQAFHQMPMLLKTYRSTRTASDKEKHTSYLKFTGRLRHMMTNLSRDPARSGSAKAFIAIDLTQADGLFYQASGLIKALRIFSPSIRNIFFFSSADKLHMPLSLQIGLRRLGVPVPILDERLKSASTLLAIEKQEKLGLFSMTQENLSASRFLRRFVWVGHTGKKHVDELDVFERRVLIMTKVFLALAVGLGIEPAALKHQLADQFGESGTAFIHFEDNRITIMLDEIHAVMLSARSVGASA